MCLRGAEEKEVQPGEDRGHGRTYSGEDHGVGGAELKSLFIWGFFFYDCSSCLTITAVAVKGTSTDSVQRECKAERRHQIAPMSHPIATMSAIHLGSPEHPQGKLSETNTSMPAGRGS